MKDSPKPDERDARVLQIYEDLLEIEQRLIPTGLHIFGRPSANTEKVDLLKMIASFDRPECGARSLPTLVAEGLGIARDERKDVDQRNRIDAIVASAVREF